MAKFNVFSKTLMLLSTVVMISNMLVFAEEDQEPDPIIEQHIIPAGAPDDYANALEAAPESEDDKYVRNCADQMTLECSKLVVFYMFNEHLNVTKSCCGQLVKMGEPCHIALVKSIFELPDLKALAAAGIPRSKELWNKCVLIVEDNTSSPVPL